MVAVGHLCYAAVCSSTDNYLNLSAGALLYDQEKTHVLSVVLKPVHC